MIPSEQDYDAKILILRALMLKTKETLEAFRRDLTLAYKDGLEDSSEFVKMITARKEKQLKEIENARAFLHQVAPW